MSIRSEGEVLPPGLIRPGNTVAIAIQKGFKISFGRTTYVES